MQTPLFRTMPAPPVFAEEIKKRRLAKGWTQQQLAIKTGINRACIGAYEEGRAQPRLEKFIKICEVFGIKIFKNYETEIAEVPKKEAAN